MKKLLGAAQLYKGSNRQRYHRKAKGGGRKEGRGVKDEIKRGLRGPFMVNVLSQSQTIIQSQSTYIMLTSAWVIIVWYT